MAPERTLRDAPNCDDQATSREIAEKAKARGNLGAARRTIRGLGPRVCRDDVPEEDVVDEPEPGECPLHDRRGRLRRPFARQLALGSEGEARDARASVAGRLPDEEHVGVRTLGEVLGQPSSEQASPRPVGVLVEGLADPRACELCDEVFGS